MTAPAVPTKRPRSAPHIKMRPMTHTAWWTEFTAPLLAFVLSGPTRSNTEIEAWCRARYYTNVTRENMVAFLDLSRKMAIVSGAGDLTLWGKPPTPIECPACRAEHETGGVVRNLALHSCVKRLERAS